MQDTIKKTREFQEVVETMDAHNFFAGDDEMNVFFKKQFHEKGKAVLLQVAEDLGFNESQYKIRYNKGGICSPGQITLHSDFLYVDFLYGIKAKGLDGQIERVEIVYRDCKGQSDTSGGVNNFFDYAALNNYPDVLGEFRKVVGLI